MDSILKEFYEEVKTLKESGHDNDSIRIVLLKKGLDKQSIEQIINKLTPVNKSQQRISALKQIVFGALLVFISIYVCFVLAYTTPAFVIIATIIACIGFFKLGHGLIKLI